MNLSMRLKEITSTPLSHATLLGKLSFLEKSGHQKLLRYKKRFGIVDKDFNKHLSDEARHAKILREFSLKFNSDPVSIDIPTKNYISKLEVNVIREVKTHGLSDPRIVYLLLTLILEMRAGEFYPAYEQVLREWCLDISVMQIINDEDEHLVFIRKELESLSLPSSVLESCQVFEESSFSSFLSSIFPSTL